MTKSVLLCIVALGVFLNPLTKGSVLPQEVGSRLIKVNNVEQLDDGGKVFLGWEVDKVKGEITFEMEAATTGYVGFGISPQGSMTGADIFVAGVYPNGTAYSSDRHGTGFTTPVLDTHADWVLLEATEFQSLGRTFLRFSRLLDTCDDEDYPISNGTNRLIWAMGATDDLAYHTASRRGSRSMDLLAAPTPEVDLDKMQSWEMTLNMPIPKAKTTYWCSFHKAPLLQKKHQIVAFQAYLESQAALKHTHHFILYNCFVPVGSNQTLEQIFERVTVDKGVYGDNCYTQTQSPRLPINNCPEYLFVWAKGGKTMLFPENVGYPIATGVDAGQQQYYMLEVHYDNPEVVEDLTFETGVKVYYTDDLRPIDAGLVTLGHQVNAALTVPPMTDDFITVGHCSPGCTNLLPESGLTVFNVLMHSHLAGRKLKLRQFRGREELPWIDFDGHYDFDYQQNKMLIETRKILPGDHLTYECHYDTTWKGGMIVTGGLSTIDEMCEAFVWYYPKLNFDICLSAYPTNTHFADFGITARHSIPSYGPQKYYIDEPAYLEGDFEDSISFKFNWTAEFREKFQQKRRFGGHTVQCGSRRAGGYTNFQNQSYPLNFLEYKPVDVCSTEKH